MKAGSQPILLASITSMLLSYSCATTSTSSSFYHFQTYPGERVATNDEAALYFSNVKRIAIGGTPIDDTKNLDAETPLWGWGEAFSGVAYLKPGEHTVHLSPLRRLSNWPWSEWFYKKLTFYNVSCSETFKSGQTYDVKIIIEYGGRRAGSYKGPAYSTHEWFAFCKIIMR